MPEGAVPSPAPPADGFVRVRMSVAYDGTPFHGFARNPDVVTVQGELEDTLAQVLRHPVAVTGAGRTDAGVHARAQVVSFDADASHFEPSALGRALNRMLGPTIAVDEVEATPPTFDARFGHTSATTSTCPPTGVRVSTCVGPGPNQHGHTYWQPNADPWTSNARPYGNHGCGVGAAGAATEHRPAPACSNSGPTQYLTRDTGVLAEYSWDEGDPRPAAMMTRIRNGEIFFHSRDSIDQCQPVNTCPSNPANGHLPATASDARYSSHGCNPHVVPACAEFGQPAATYHVHDPNSNNNWPRHRLETVTEHHNPNDASNCHATPQCVPQSVVAEAAANTNPQLVEYYAGVNGERNEWGQWNGTHWDKWGLVGKFFHAPEDINSAPEISECPRRNLRPGA